METTQNPTPEVPKTSKTHYETLDEKITKMKVTFDNAMLPEIFVVMATVGYTAEKIDDMKARLSQLIQLNTGQIKEGAKATAAQDRFDNKKAEINGVFNTHRGLARILFNENVDAHSRLQFHVENPVAYGNWNQLVSRFYSQLQDPDMQTEAITVGITPDKIVAQQQALSDLDAMKDLIVKENGKAHAATDARDNAYDELYPLYYTYVKYAKLLITDVNLLEMIGIKVKSK